MRGKAIILITLFLFAVTTPLVAQEDENSSNFPKFSISGFANAEYRGGNVDDKLRVGWFRIYPQIHFSDRLSFLVEVDATNVDTYNFVETDYLHQFKLIWKASRKVTAYAGRGFNQMGYGTFAPKTLKTAIYPPGAYPFDNYYALQAGFKFDLSHGWTSRIAVAGGATDSFRRVDLSSPQMTMYASRSIGVTTYGFSSQFSEEFWRGGFNVDTEVGGRLRVAGGVFANSDRAEWLSGLLFLEYAVGNKFLPHTQIHRSIHGGWTWTSGLAIVHGPLKYIGDLIVPLSDGKHPHFALRTQITF